MGGGSTYARVFRSWDRSHDGFLSYAELERGLRQFPALQMMTADNMKSFMDYIECGGTVSGRVGMLEFVRAVIPRSVSTRIQQFMVRERLKPIWIARPKLHKLLVRCDPSGTNWVSLDEFKGCLNSVNEYLTEFGLLPLTALQIEAVCERVSKRGQVEYDRFLKGLHVIDADNVCV
eukprot:NODE_5556_length_572_cov_405.090909.p1 GENE.NODE_5556_length_572_cov_405.090909~~NODE_5556_length_572_cov_405.090909.p1  ORF type:complete len:176 (+),score=33.97 NODE_5556_length_572_cov_405.090909:3-530(+)